MHIEPFDLRAKIRHLSDTRICQEHSVVSGDYGTETVVMLGSGLSSDTLTQLADVARTPQIFIGGERIGGADAPTGHLTQVAV